MTERFVKRPDWPILYDPFRDIRTGPLGPVGDALNIANGLRDRLICWWRWTRRSCCHTQMKGGDVHEHGCFLGLCYEPYNLMCHGSGWTGLTEKGERYDAHYVCHCGNCPEWLRLRCCAGGLGVSGQQGSEESAQESKEVTQPNKGCVTVSNIFQDFS